MIVRLRGEVRNGMGSRLFALASGVPTAIESALPVLVLDNSAIFSTVIKDAGIKVEVNLVGTNRENL